MFIRMTRTQGDSGTGLLYWTPDRVLAGSIIVLAIILGWQCLQKADTCNNYLCYAQTVQGRAILAVFFTRATLLID